MSVCIRPESINVQKDAPQASEGLNALQGTVQVLVFQGSHLRCAVQIDNGPVVEVLSYDIGDNELRHGDRVWVTTRPDECMVLPAETFGEE